VLYNVTKKTVVVNNLRIAGSFKERLTGLMFRKSIGSSEGLMLMGCNAIHTCFMRFSLDVVFMDMNYRVVYIKEKIKPWRQSGFIHKAHIALELPEGTVNKKNIAVGDILFPG